MSGNNHLQLRTSELNLHNWLSCLQVLFLEEVYMKTWAKVVIAIFVVLIAFVAGAWYLLDKIALGAI